MMLARKRVWAMRGPQGPGPIPENKDGKTMTRHEENGGKGLSRVKIAQRAVDSLRAKLEAAEARLEEAKKKEKEGGAKKKEKVKKVRERAIKVLMDAKGINRDEAIKILDR